MTLFYPRSFFLALIPLMAGATHLLAYGASSLVSIGTVPEIYLNGAPPSKYVISFYNEWIPMVVMSKSEISYEYSSWRSLLSDIYIVNKDTLPIDDEDDEQDSNDVTNPLCNIHFEYDEKNRLRKISNSQGTFMLFFCEGDDRKISKIIYNDGKVLFDSSSIFRDLYYPKELDQEEQRDCIKLFFAGSQTSPPDYYEISYYRNAQNIWKFGYRWQPTIFPFERLAEILRR